MVTIMLEKAGHTVKGATTGTEVVRLFSETKFDLILMDIQMPEMDGVQATAIIRAQQGGARIPIVALTAHALEGDKEKYLNLGMNAYIAKPIDRTALLQTIGALAERDSGEQK